MISKNILPLLLIGLIMMSYAEATLLDMAQCYISCGIRWAICYARSDSTQTPVCGIDFEENITDCLSVGTEHAYSRHPMHHRTSDSF